MKYLIPFTVGLILFFSENVFADEYSQLQAACRASKPAKCIKVERRARDDGYMTYNVFCSKTPPQGKVIRYSMEKQKYKSMNTLVVSSGGSSSIFWRFGFNEATKGINYKTLEQAISAYCNSLFIDK